MQVHSPLEFKFADGGLGSRDFDKDSLSYHSARQVDFENISIGIKGKDWDKLFDGKNCEYSFELFSKIYHELCTENIRNKRI